MRITFFPGLVTPVRNQGNCGSCVAFATAANVETCFKKVTGVFGDYSEQHMLDCGRKYKGAAACRGAATHSYTDWLADKKVQPASEEQYPYIAKQQKCSKPMPSFDQVKEETYTLIIIFSYFLSLIDAIHYFNLGR